MSDDDKFKYEILKVFNSERVDSKNRIDLMVIHWGSAKAPALEKRRIWEVDGEIRFRKLVGMNVDDLQFIVDNQDEIRQLLGGGE